MDTTLLHLDALIANGYRGRSGDMRVFHKGLTQATRDHEADEYQRSLKPGSIVKMATRDIDRAVAFETDGFRDQVY